MMRFFGARNAGEPDLILFVYGLCCTVGLFAGPFWAVVAIPGGLLVAIAAWRRSGIFPMPDRALLGLAAAALATMAVTNLFSTTPAVSWHKTVQLATIFIPLTFWSSPGLHPYALKTLALVVLPVLVIAGIASLSLVMLLSVPLLHAAVEPLANTAGYHRGMSYLIIMSFAILARLWNTGRPGAALAFALFLLTPLILTESSANNVAFVFAFLCVVAVYCWPRASQRALMVLPVLLLGWPFASQWAFTNAPGLVARLPATWRARVEIWDSMSFRIQERPWLGWGAGSSHLLPFREPHGSQYVFTLTNPGHPHNVVIQLWVELGVPGLVLGLIFAWVTLHWVGQLDRRLVPFASGAWMAALFISLVAYDFWTDSLFSAFALTGLAFAIVQRQLMAAA